MAKKQIDGDGLDIPNRIKALPVKRTGPIVAAVIVALLAAMLLQGLITNPRFEWNVVGKYLFNENVLEGIKYTLLLTVISMVIAIVLAVILAVMRKSINPVLRGVSWFYIWFFRGTPVYIRSWCSGVCSPYWCPASVWAFLSRPLNSGALTRSPSLPRSTRHGWVSR